MVTTVTTDPVTGLPVTVQKSGSAAKEQEDRFLKLLVAQMRNQDPLNPLDNAQVTTQMAQLSTVSGIEKLNTTLQSMSQTQAYQAAGMIGRGVLSTGSFIDLSNGAAVAGVDLPKSADSVKVKIFDSNNQLVKELDLGKKDAGSSLFGWDGTTSTGTNAPDGAYTFSVQATQGGISVAPVSLAVGLVNSVLMDKTGPKLNVEGMGLVDMSAVRQIL
jgi:flagellar basal-body rod modification protein FlgD